MNNSIDEWRTERDALIKCRNDFSEHGQFSLDNSKLSITESLYGMIEKHGVDRVRLILAATVRDGRSKGRYDRAVNGWSLDIPYFPQPFGNVNGQAQDSDFYIQAHPTAINIAAQLYIADEKWRDNYAALVMCKDAFLLNDNFERCYFDFLDDGLPRELENIVNQHGIENVRQVLALTINSLDEKSTHCLEPEVLAWAKATTPFPQPPNPNTPYQDYGELALDAFLPKLINEAARETMMLEAQRNPPLKPKRGGDAR